MKDSKQCEHYERFFKEMAFSKGQIESTIINSDIVRAEHLILIFLCKHDRANSHWQSEISAQLLRIAKMKWSNNHKYLSDKGYFNNLWTKPFENKDNYHIINEIVDDLLFDGYPISKNWEEHKSDLVLNLKRFYSKVSVLMSKGRLSKEVVYELLKEFRN
jgi:hypothetical protein